MFGSDRTQECWATRTLRRSICWVWSRTLYSAFCWLVWRLGLSARGPCWGDAPRRSCAIPHSHIASIQHARSLPNRGFPLSLSNPQPLPVPQPLLLPWLASRPVDWHVLQALPQHAHSSTAHGTTPSARPAAPCVPRPSSGANLVAHTHSSRHGSCAVRRCSNGRGRGSCTARGKGPVRRTAGHGAGEGCEARPCVGERSHGFARAGAAPQQTGVRWGQGPCRQVGASAQVPPPVLLYCCMTDASPQAGPLRRSTGGVRQDAQPRGRGVSLGCGSGLRCVRPGRAGGRRREHSAVSTFTPRLDREQASEDTYVCAVASAAASTFA
jgi:hypothetical protein